MATSHSFTVLSLYAAASIVPSGENATERTSKFLLYSPRMAILSRVITSNSVFVRVVVSHNSTRLLSRAVASIVPSGENATEVTSPLPSPKTVAIRSFFTISHRLKVLSSDPAASIVPSGENATEVKPSPPDPTSFPKTIAEFVGVPTSHSRIVSSLDAEASIVPSGENATEVTSFLWPSRVATFVSAACAVSAACSIAAAASHSFTV